MSYWDIYPQKFTEYAKIQECQEEIRSVVQQLVKSVDVDGPNEVILIEGGLIILWGLLFRVARAFKVTGIQGDHSGCDKPPVKTKTNVAF